MLGNPDYGIREIFACEIWNSVEFCLWNLESRIQLKQSRIPLTIGIQFQWQRLESSTWNLESMAWNPESKTIVDFLTQSERVIILMRRGPSHSTQ